MLDRERIEAQLEVPLFRRGPEGEHAVMKNRSAPLSDEEVRVLEDELACEGGIGAGYPEDDEPGHALLFELRAELERRAAVRDRGSG